MIVIASERPPEDRSAFFVAESERSNLVFSAEGGPASGGKTEIASSSAFGRLLAMAVCVIIIGNSFVFAQDTEVLPKTNTKVVVREHPKTGFPYTAIISASEPDRGGTFAGMKKISRRPDYRMLDPKIKSGTIPYEGPVSDRKKIYVFAASIAALGAGGAALLPIAPVTGAGAAGGAGALAAAGAGVASGTAGAVAISMKQNPKQEDYTHVSKSEKS